ncbi:hypothetical protein B0H13DRAFT_2555670 [Mycena leptocephala]|nr:hypothetical protein B0H13DRAFT_2555670 [Mycena leptocephala]
MVNKVSIICTKKRQPNPNTRKPPPRFLLGRFSDIVASMSRSTNDRKTHSMLHLRRQAPLEARPRAGKQSHIVCPPAVMSLHAMCYAHALSLVAATALYPTCFSSSLSLRSGPCSHVAPRPGVSTRWRPRYVCGGFHPDADTGVCAVGHMWISCKAHGLDASWSFHSWAISSTGDAICAISFWGNLAGWSVFRLWTGAAGARTYGTGGAGTSYRDGTTPSEDVIRIRGVRCMEGAHLGNILRAALCVTLLPYKLVQYSIFLKFLGRFINIG